ncbi:MAG TPA: sugar phosphate nucleotidyltransferase [Roseiflexaceae bacterium]|nr:sugar phosphate nucleotidyltransferase [Roseiflexaceae bacterium]
MKVIIPTAGLGTRLRPHTYSKPKPLVSVAGKPVLGHVLDTLSALAIDELIFITGYLGNQIEEYVRKTYPLPARFIEQTELKGQAHAVYLAREHVQGPTLILYVDTIFEADLRQLADLEGDGAIYVKEVDDPRRFGVAFVGENGYITRLVEKPDTDISKLAMIGLYYLKDGQWLMRAIEEMMARNIQTKGEFYLTDALQIMIDQGAKFIAAPVSVWEDCGKPETVLQTNRYLLRNGRAHQGPTKSSIVIPPVYIDDTAQVEHSIVGPYVSIAAGAVVKDSIIRDSIINREALIQSAMLQNSLVGDDAIVQGDFHELNIGDSSEIRFD